MGITLGVGDEVRIIPKLVAHVPETPADSEAYSAYQGERLWS